MKLPSFIRRLIPWLARRPQIYALVGKSGTGKSFKARAVSQRYRIDLIIDDGLLIKGQKIVAGKSAKREKGILGAIKTALFVNPDQVAEVKKALAAESYHRILLIATSVKMIERIRKNLELPPLQRTISIEDVSKPQEIAAALAVRAKEGKHIIPVPAVEIKRNYPHIFFESIKILLKGRTLPRARKDAFVEKTVVRPAYGRMSPSPSKKIEKSI
jgi:hypothetical protein